MGGRKMTKEGERRGERKEYEGGRPIGEVGEIRYK
jgi:hypothetical protein